MEPKEKQTEETKNGERSKQTGERMAMPRTDFGGGGLHGWKNGAREGRRRGSFLLLLLLLRRDGA
jgi:hypothetical protein